jgi:hypothetical protein
VPDNLESLEPHLLPNGAALTNFSAFFNNATFNKDGSCTVKLVLPPEEKRHVVALSNNDGMLLNFSAWETAMPDGAEALAEIVGLA